MSVLYRQHLEVLLQIISDGPKYSTVTGILSSKKFNSGLQSIYAYSINIVHGACSNRMYCLL